MANVKICDRCGKTFDAKRNWFSLKPVRYILGLAFTKHVWGGTEDCYVEFDICPSCLGDLKKFLRGEATDALDKE